MLNCLLNSTDFYGNKVYKTFSYTLKQKLSSFHKTACILRFLQEERNTWRLLRTLFQDRLDSENMDENDVIMDTLVRIFLLLVVLIA